jgi:hypothetical protein
MNRPRLLTLTLLTVALLSVASTRSNAQSAANPAAMASGADNPLLAHLPADADKVYHINYTALSGKIDWESLANVIFKNEEAKRTFGSIAVPQRIGIDLRYGLFATQSNVLKLDSPRYTTLLIALNDSAKFIQFIKDSHREADGKLIIHSGRLRTAIQGRTVLAWDDKMVAITFVKAPAMSPVMSPKPQKPGAAPTAEALMRKYILTATRRSIAALKPSPANAVATDADFRAAIADDADAHIYSHFGGGFGMMGDAMRMAHAPVNGGVLAAMEQMKRSRMHSIGTVRFDNGKMSLRSRLYFDSLAGLDLGLRPNNTDLVERLPQGNLLGIIALHIDPITYLNIVKRFSGDKGLHVIDSALAKKGLTTKDLLSAFKGDLLIAAVDNGQPIPATDSTKAKPSKPTFYIVVSIADKAAFDKVNSQLNLLKDSTATAPPADSTGQTPSKPKKPLAHTYRDGLLVLSAEKQATEDYFKSPAHGPSRLETEEVRSAPLAIAIDIKALATWLGPTMTGSAKDQQAKIVMGLFDQIVFTGGKTRGREMETLFEIKMADSQENSLTTISKLISMMGGKK